MDNEPEVKGEEGERETTADRKRPGQKKKASCYWDGKRYSHGGVVKGPDGAIYRCSDGEWIEDLGTLEPAGSKSP